MWFGKQKCWKVFEQPYLIQNLGRDSTQNDTEEFVCRLYRVPNIEAGVNKCRTTNPSIRTVFM